MSTGKHSPSPWSVAPDFSDDHGQFSILCAEGCGIAMAEAWIGEHRAEATANARLIAAAPELLEATKELKELFRFALLSTTPEIAREGMEFIRKAETIVAKAEGATP